MLADPETDIAPCVVIRAEIFVGVDVIQRRPVKIGAPADQHRDSLGNRLQDLAASFSCGDFCVLGKFWNSLEQIFWRLVASSTIVILVNVLFCIAPYLVVR